MITILIPLLTTILIKNSIKDSAISNIVNALIKEYNKKSFHIIESHNTEEIKHHQNQLQNYLLYTMFKTKTNKEIIDQYNQLYQENCKGSDIKYKNTEQTVYYKNTPILKLLNDNTKSKQQLTKETNKIHDNIKQTIIQESIIPQNSTKPKGLKWINKQWREEKIVTIGVSRMSTKDLTDNLVDITGTHTGHLILTKKNAKSAVKGKQWLTIIQMLNHIQKYNKKVQLVSIKIYGKIDRTIRGYRNVWMILKVISETEYRFTIDVQNILKALGSIETTILQDAVKQLGKLKKKTGDYNQEGDRKLEKVDIDRMRKGGITYLTETLRPATPTPIEKILVDNNIEWLDDISKMFNKDIYDYYKSQNTLEAQLDRANSKIKEKDNQIEELIKRVEALENKK